MTFPKDIESFLYLLEKTPNIFQSKQAWQYLPELNEKIATLADNETDIAAAIKDWCVKHGLGEELRNSLRADFRPGNLKPDTKPPIDNLTQILRESILTAHNQQQNASLANIADTNNEPN